MENLTDEKCKEQFEKWLKSTGQNPPYATKRGYWEIWKASREALDKQERGEWIEWGGKGTPVNDPVVEVRFRDGELDKALASHWVWFHSDSEDDIIAYRIINQKEG